jgi:hypothetical protein
MRILAIDPGNTYSAYTIIGDGLKPIEFNKVDNDVLMDLIQFEASWQFDMCAIEMIASYGMAVGASVFETCVWIGRFTQAIKFKSMPVEYVYRKDVKLNLCGTTKAKDSNISQALKDRFGVVGVKKAPGWFFGFHHDIWAAYAVGVTYADRVKAG